MHTRTETIDGQEVKIKVYATRKRRTNRQITDSISRSKVKRWEKLKEDRRKEPAIPVVFQPKQQSKQEDEAAL